MVKLARKFYFIFFYSEAKGLEHLESTPPVDVLVVTELRTQRSRQFELFHFANQHDRLFQSTDQAPAPIALLNEHRVLLHEVVKAASLVDLGDQLALSILAAFVDEESYDGFGYLIADCLLNDVEVTVDQVLNHASLHDHTRTLLLLARHHRLWHAVKRDLWQIMLSLFVT